MPPTDQSRPSSGLESLTFIDLRDETSQDDEKKVDEELEREGAGPEQDDEVDKESADSMPASDPPSF